MFQSVTKPDIIVITESWLSDNILDEQITLPGFGSPFRQDRQDGRKGGGVCVYVKKNVPCIPVFNTIKFANNQGKCERVLLKFTGTNIILLAMYVPPNLCKRDQEDIIVSISDTFECILASSDSAKLLLAGDLNDLSTTELELQFALTQVVDKPTRGSAILDKILLGDKLVDMYNPPTVGPNLSTSDHHSVSMLPIELNTEMTRLKKVYDFRESNISQFLKELDSYNWSNFYKAAIDIDDKTTILYERISKAQEHIPCDFVEMRTTDKPWLTPKLKLLINKRFQAYRTKNWTLFNHLKLKVRKEVAKAKSAWLQKSSSTSCGLWKVVSEVRNKRYDYNLSTLLSSFPSLSIAADSINEALCENFSASPDWSTIMHNLKYLADNDISGAWNTSITVNDVYEELRNLQIRKAAGSDGLSPRLLVAGADIFAPILTHLIALSIESRRFPHQWKVANIVPIPKRKSPAVNDLRPISLLPIFAKICEKVVISSVKKDIIEQFGQDQFGFRPKSSTALAHIRLHDFITCNMDLAPCNGVLLISFDMSRAFDCLNHEALMKTLVRSGLPVHFVMWCADYLQNRQQKVVFENTSSKPMNITSGVPQGSVIAPFLFCLQMKSAKPASRNSIIIKYADDILVAMPVSKESVITTIISEETSHMREWCHENGLRLNSEKTKSLLIPKKGHVPSSDTPACDILGELRILGLIYNSNGNWSSHISHIAKKASRMFFVLRQLKNFLPKSLLFKIYYALIRSRLEYCSAVFVGLSTTESDRLDKIQKRCHKIICGEGCDCELPALRKRRETIALKIFCDMQHPDHILHQLFPAFLPHGKRLAYPLVKTNRRTKSFIPFCIHLHNSTH